MPRYGRRTSQASSTVSRAKARAACASSETPWIARRLSITANCRLLCGLAQDSPSSPGTGAKECRTMRSNNSPNDSSLKSARPFKTLTRCFSMRTPSWTRLVLVVFMGPCYLGPRTCRMIWNAGDLGRGPPDHAAGRASPDHAAQGVQPSTRGCCHRPRAAAPNSRLSGAVPRRHADRPRSRGHVLPLDTRLEFNITTLVIGLPRQVVVQRCNQADVDLVLRDDAAMWPPRIRWGARARPGHRAGERK